MTWPEFSNKLTSFILVSIDEQPLTKLPYVGKTPPTLEFASVLTLINLASNKCQFTY